MRWLIALPLLLSVAAPLAAQAPFNTRDTLRFLQEVRTTGEMQTPMGSQPMNVNMRMISSVVGLGGDSVASWMDSVAMTPSMPAMSGPLEAMRGRRVIMHFLPDGRIRMGDGVNNSFGFTGVTQMNATIWGFALPMRGELRRGVSWSDTTTMRIDTLGATVNMNSITRYEVLGDSVYEGMPVLTLATAQTSTTSSAGAMSMDAKAQGTGRAYFSRALGIVVYQTSVVQVNQDMRVGDMSMQGKSQVEATYRMLRKR